MPDTAKPGDNSDLEVDFKDVETFLKDMNDKQKSVSEATGSLRSHLKGALDKHGWNKGAAAMIRQIDGYSETARDDFLRTFEPMYTIMTEQKWADERQDLFNDTTETEPAT